MTEHHVTENYRDKRTSNWHKKKKQYGKKEQQSPLIHNWCLALPQLKWKHEIRFQLRLNYSNMLGDHLPAICPLNKLLNCCSFCTVSNHVEIISATNLKPCWEDVLTYLWFLLRLQCELVVLNDFCFVLSGTVANSDPSKVLCTLQNGKLGKDKWSAPPTQWNADGPS